VANGQITIIPASGDSAGKGQQIKITSTTAGAANTLHTATSTGSNPNWQHWHDVTILVTNRDSTSRTLTLLWGGTTNPDDYIPLDCYPGQITSFRGRLTGGAVVKAFCAAAADVLSCRVEVDRQQVNA
jgi:hypothetical protein